MRCAVILLLLVCTACGFGQMPRQIAREQAAPMVSTPHACHIGPDDGPVLAERGIGGTGMTPFNSALPAMGTPPSAQPNTSPTGQNRGIGGTGGPATGPKGVADKTGIVGEITGFGSVCLNGVEVAYGPATPIEVDGQAESASALRAGQIAAILAAPSGDAEEGLQAATVAIRHEVSGPVEEVNASALTVAGQTVLWNVKTRGVTHIAPGDWVAVSGLRNDSGAIVATRIDPRDPGIVTVHGKISKKQGAFWIGGLQLRLPPMSRPPRGGEYVTATGDLNGLNLYVQSVLPDLLYSDPQAYFGPTVKHLLIQSYIYTLGGTMHLAVGTSIYLAEGKLFYNPSEPSILSLVLSPRGTLLAVGQLLGAVGGYIPFTGSPHKSWNSLLP